MANRFQFSLQFLYEEFQDLCQLFSDFFGELGVLERINQAINGISRYINYLITTQADLESDISILDARMENNSLRVRLLENRLSSIFVSTARFRNEVDAELWRINRDLEEVLS